jgi:hypothetical protein
LFALIGLGRRRQSKKFQMVWETEFGLNTCKNKKFNIENSTITIRVNYLKKDSFFNGRSKIEVHMDDEMKTIYLAEDIDVLNSNDTTALTSKQWKELISLNNECSKDVYKTLHNEDRKSNVDIKTTYKCFIWTYSYGTLLNGELYEDLKSGCGDKFFQNDTTSPVKLQKTIRESLHWAYFSAIV